MESRDAEVVLRMITHVWIRQYGAPKFIVSDREGALASDEGIWADRWQIQLRLRPKDAHAHVVQRHNEMLRQSYHKIRSQCAQDGLTCTKEEMLDEAVFAKNALTSVHGQTPYQALHGRVPNLLTNFDPEASPALDDETGGAASRHVHRLREIALSTILTGLAQDRLNRALSTRTRPAGELTGLRAGDLVEFYRAPPNKDVTGWRGPAPVVSLDRLGEEGVIEVRWQSRVIACQVRDVRRALSVAALLCHHLRGDYPGEPPQLVLQHFVDGLQRTMMVLGCWLSPEGEDWVLSADARKHYREYLAALHVAVSVFNMDGCIAVRIGHGVHQLTAAPGMHRAYLWWWQRGRLQESWNIAHYPDGKINLKELFGEQWTASCFVQFLLVDPATMVRARETHPDIPMNGGRSVPSDRASRGTDTPRSLPEARGVAHPRDEERDEEEADRATQWRRIEDFEDTTKYGYAEEPTDPDDWAASCRQEEDWLSFIQKYDVPNFEHHLPADRIVLSRIQLSPSIPEGTIEWPPITAHWLVGLPRGLDHDEVLIMRIRVDGQYQATVEREARELSPEEKIEHRVAMAQAMFDELERWHKLQAFARRPRRTCGNLLDCRWVIRWKCVDDEWVIRARLTVRGFKDRQAGELATFSGTASRFGQRVINLLASQHKLTLFSADVAQAFLKGMTFGQIQKLTGETRREVQLELPNASIPLLRRLPTFSDFNPALECLDMIRPGFGLVDAPRAWGMALTPRSPAPRSTSSRRSPTRRCWRSTPDRH